MHARARARTMAGDSLKDIARYGDRLFDYAIDHALPALGVVLLGVVVTALLPDALQLFMQVLYVPGRGISITKRVAVTLLLLATVAATVTLLGLPFYYGLVTYGIFQYIVSTAVLPSLRRLIEGYAVLISLPMRVGDIVSVDGIRGRVKEFNTTHVTLSMTAVVATGAGRQHVRESSICIPNDIVTSSIVIIEQGDTASSSSGADTDADAMDDDYDNNRRLMQERASANNAVRRAIYRGGGGGGGIGDSGLLGSGGGGVGFA